MPTTTTTGGGGGGGSPAELDEALAVARRAAHEAGAAIRACWYGGASAVQKTKSAHTDLVTETDQRCEEMIVAILREAFPSHEIIGEEDVGAGGAGYELTARPTWTVDPIDGTTNFVHRIAQSCVIMAYLEHRQVLLGVVYDPIADELFWATKGGGAWLDSPRSAAAGASNPRRLACSNTTEISRAVVGLEVGYRRGADHGVPPLLAAVLVGDPPPM
jgi:inositol-phosphate phosphatase/L-galactose 1-phosphate phosphatase